ncbi:MAG: hypothetical protein WCF23_24100, partial [Candidatus Nitrosopolaris sp.]
RPIMVVEVKGWYRINDISDDIEVGGTLSPKLIDAVAKKVDELREAGIDTINLSSKDPTITEILKKGIDDAYRQDYR